MNSVRLVLLIKMPLEESVDDVKGTGVPPAIAGKFTFAKFGFKE